MEEITLEIAKKQRPLQKLSINMRITGWISPYFIYLFAKLGIPPNLITFLWIIISFISFYFIALGSYWNMVLGILIYHFAIFLDSIDGGLARITHKTNAGGEFLDRFFSTLNRSIILLVMGIGLFKVRGDYIFLYLGIFSSAFLALENLVKMKKYESLINSNRLDIVRKIAVKNKNSEKNIKFYIAEAFRPGNHFTLSFFAIIFNFVGLYLYAYSILVFIQFLRVFYKEFKELKRTPQRI